MSAAAAQLVAVRVLAGRSLSLPAGNGDSVHHIAGDVLELPADEAAQLVTDGYVEPSKRAAK